MVLWMKLILSLLIPLGAGYGFFQYLCRPMVFPFLFQLACSFGLGIGFVAYWMLFLGIFQLPYNFWTIGAPLLGLGILFLAVSSRFSQQRQPISFQQTQADRLPFLCYLLIMAFIWVNIYYVFARAVSMPVTDYDALATIAYKAKVIYYSKTLPDLSMLPHASYPLLIPFNQAWIGYVLGSWSSIYIKIIFPFCLFSYLIIHYYFLSYFTNKNWAIFGVFLLLSSNLLIFHATISYRDLFLMYFNCSTIIFLILWHRTGITSLLWLASLFAGFASFTKLEGSAYLLIYFLIFYFLNKIGSASQKTKRTKDLLIFIGPGLGLCLSFHIYKYFHFFMKNSQAGFEKIEPTFALEHLWRTPQILQEFTKALFYTNDWNIIWLVLLFSFIRIREGLKRTEVKVLLFTVISYFVLYYVVFIATSNYYWIVGEKSSDALSRLVLHFFPLSTLLIVLLNFPATKKD
ncbi:MAG TPA: hypothetical protein VI749_00400 [Candidatus Omnitrophota bacterium]|nr:hypothetical protein [Candidatus Omnitrophota bacterium]